MLPTAIIADACNFHSLYLFFFPSTEQNNVSQFRKRSFAALLQGPYGFSSIFKKNERLNPILSASQQQ
jgi:hypothetical protein